MITHIPTANILDMGKCKATNYYCRQIWNHARAFCRQIYIWLYSILIAKIKVTHILTINISEMVTDGERVTSDIKLLVIYWFSTDNLHLTLAYFRGLGQGYAHFDSKLLGNGDWYVTLKLQSNWKSSMGFQLTYLHLTYTNSKVKVVINWLCSISTANILEMVIDWTALQLRSNRKSDMRF